MLEPVFGDVAIDERIARYVRESKEEEKPQEQTGKEEDQEIPPKLPEHARERAWLRPPQRVDLLFKHVANIASDL